jgi:hypothetical protein
VTRTPGPQPPGEDDVTVREAKLKAFDEWAERERSRLAVMESLRDNHDHFSPEVFDALVGPYLEDRDPCPIVIRWWYDPRLVTEEPR